MVFILGLTLMISLPIFIINGFFDSDEKQCFCSYLTHFTVYVSFSSATIKQEETAVGF